MQEIRKLGPNAFRVLLSCAVFGILVVNIILVRQNRRLKSPEFTQIRAGQHLMNLAAATLDGNIESIGLPTVASPRLVIFTFSPNCRFCQETQPVWAELSRDLRARGIDALWVSRDTVTATRAYSENIRMPLSNVVADPPNRTFVQLGLQAVPNTIVVGPGGLVEKVWSGALDRETAPAVFSYFGIHQDPARSAGASAQANQSGPSKCCAVSAQRSTQ